MKMIDLGEKVSSETMAMPMEKQKDRIDYPYLNINKDLGLDEDDVGQEIEAKVRLKVRKIGKEISTTDKGTKKRDDNQFDVLAISIDKAELESEMKDQLGEKKED